MQPVCVLLPGGLGVAPALWKTFELGMATHSQPSRQRSVSVPELEPTHLRNLLDLLRDHLVGSSAHQNTIWLHRRELRALLQILDQGLTQLRLLDEDQALRCTEAVSRFLANLPTAKPAPRKSAHRHQEAAKAMVTATAP